jgi:HrpA-like RNA helicase
MNSLPKIPSMTELGLTVNDIRGNYNKTSDGTKKVPYIPNKQRNVRVNQTRFQPAPAKTSWQKVKTYPTLPITSHGEKITQLIQENPIIAIDAPTSVGKTRYIPYLMTTKGFKVRVAIPTTVAVRDAYKFQHEHSKLRVGFAAGREIRYADDDQLVYATTGHFTQRIISMLKANLGREKISDMLGDILFIDEVHSATSHITVLIGLMRYLFSNTQYLGPRIVFASATFNHGDIMDHFPNFPVYKVDIPSYPIEEIFLLNSRDPLKDDCSDDIVRILHEETGKWQTATKKYHGIIFRPGLQEVEDTIEYLEDKFNEIEFYPAYSNLGPVEMDEIFEPSNKMKVIVGTNIIESSITIEDVGFIIDDMLEKIAETSSTGGNKLTLTVISKAASQQRKGRTGRTMPGRDYKLITRDAYEYLSPFRIREIDRIPIFDIVLQLVDANLNPLEVLKISEDRYNQAMKFLVDVNMIEIHNNRYFVTDIGRFVSSIPLSVQNSYMVYLGFQRFQDSLQKRPNDLAAERIVLRSVLAVASMIESYGPSYFYIPRRGRSESMIEYTARKDAHIEQYHEKFRGATDIHTFVNIFWEMMASINVARKYDRGTRHNFTNYIKEWTLNNSMNNKKIKEFLNVMREIESIIEGKLSVNTPLRAELPNSGQVETLPRGQLGGQGFSLGRDLPDGGYTNLGNVVAQIFARAYYGNMLVRSKGCIYLDQKNNILYKINKSASFNETVINAQEGPMEIIVGQTIEVIGKGGRFNLAGLFVTQEFIPK